MKHLSWPHHRMYIRFSDAEAGTEITVQMLFENAADREKVVVEFGAEKGLRENLERLEAYIFGL